MSRRFEMRLAGSGGQGMIVASVILSEVAVVSGLQVAQSQSYGPEARGGICRAEVVLSRERILYTRVRQPDFLLTLTQASLDKYGRALADRALVMIDDSLAPPDWLDPGQVLAVPILRTAREKLGQRFTANIVAIGALNAALGLFDRERLLDSVRRHVPPGTEALNRRAMEAGAALIEPEAEERFARKLYL